MFEMGNRAGVVLMWGGEKLVAVIRKLSTTWTLKRVWRCMPLSKQQPSENWADACISIAGQNIKKAR
jgi:hypothetical protein